MKTEDLVAKLKSCDENTAKEFLYKYTPLIIYVITPILKNEEDREDCISDVIFKVWKSISTYDSAKGNFTGWLTAISRNTALNYQKKIIHTENIEDFQNTLISPDLTPEESLISNENKQIILRAINSLPTKDRILFYRKYYIFSRPRKLRVKRVLPNEPLREGFTERKSVCVKCWEVTDLNNQDFKNLSDRELENALSLSLSDKILIKEITNSVTP